MIIPSVECNDCRIDGFYDVAMNPTGIESQGEDWVNVAYRCPRCGQRDYAMFGFSLSELCEKVSA
jgi:hypothetical protein